MFSARKVLDLPTAAEAGLPGYETYNWYGLFAPLGTPEPIIKTLNGHVASIVASPDYRALIENAGSIAISATPQEFGAVIQKTLDDTAPAVQEFGLQQDQ